MSSYDKEAIQKVINEYEKKFTHYENRIKELEENHMNFLDFWKEYGDFKSKMYHKMIGLEQNKNIQKNQYNMNQEDLFEDRLNYQAGILKSAFIDQQEQLNKRF